MNSPLQGNALRDGLPWSGGSFHNPEPFKPPSDTATTLVSALRVAHLIAQNARNHTDTDKPDRHTALNPRALAVQADTPDRFLCPGGPRAPSSNLGSPINNAQVRQSLRNPWSLVALGSETSWPDIDQSQFHVSESWSFNDQTGCKGQNYWEPKSTCRS